jgi:hypothetical protein
MMDLVLISSLSFLIWLLKKIQDARQAAESKAQAEEKLRGARKFHWRCFAERGKAELEIWQ